MWPNSQNRHTLIFIASFVASFLLVGFSQSSFSPILGIGASAFGFSWFWYVVIHRYEKRRDRFLLFVIWFGLVQAVQLSWFTSIEYMGPYILIVYGILVSLIGLQFGCLVFFFNRSIRSRGDEISFLNCLSLAGCWVILEWLRIFFFSGFTWNPVGLGLADSPYAIQFAALFGVYGLSFWVMFVNAFGLYALKCLKRGVIWFFLALFPYFYGMVQKEWVGEVVNHEKVVSAALVQTAILPEQKDRFPNRSESFIPPLNQWERIWEQLQALKKVDLIVLPESAVSMSARRYFYPIDAVKDVWESYFGKESLQDFPALEPPLARLSIYRGEQVWKVTNSYLAQALANHFKADVIIGLDDQDGSLKYNAAFFFRPEGESIARYEKRILVPVGEYAPFMGVQWISHFLSEQFGIGDSFNAGEHANLFSSSIPIGVSICLEETYSHLIRDLRIKGARLFVNVSNDVWFPHSRLPEQHFLHGRIRAAENGVCSLRACNTGITGAIDCCGQMIKILPPSEENMGVLYLALPIRSFRTLYTWWGDGAILCLSAFFLLLGLSRSCFRNRHILLPYLKIGIIYVSWYTLRRSFDIMS